MKRDRVFSLVLIALMMIAVLLIGGNIAVILWRGIRSLPQHITSKETVFAVGLSIRTACMSTLLCLLLAVPSAYVLTRMRIPGRFFIEMILELTMSLPYIVLGLSMLIIFSSPVGKAIKAAGFPVVFSQNGIILAQLVVNLPFAIKLVSTAFASVDSKLERVAGLLGASAAERFFTILLPLCRNSLISTVILVWSRALGEFGATLMLVGVTRMKTETLPASIYLNVSTNDLGAALSSAFILLVISALSLAAAALLTRKSKDMHRYE